MGSTTPGCLSAPASRPTPPSRSSEPLAEGRRFLRRLLQDGRSGLASAPERSAGSEPSSCVSRRYRAPSMSMNRWGAIFGRALLLVLVLVAGCDASPSSSVGRVRTPPPDTATPAPPTPPTASSRCPNQPDGFDAGVVGGELSGDLDGDDSEERVFLVRDEAGPPGCKTFLVVESVDAAWVVPTDEPDVDYTLQAPRINSLVEVGGAPGLEVLVDLEQGASTQFVGMFTVADEALARVRVRESSGYGDLFPYGGSVSHIEASNCTEEGGADVVVSVATANTRDYTVRRRLYEMTGAILRPVEPARQPPIATVEDLQRLPEFVSSPFGDCG